MKAIKRLITERLARLLKDHPAILLEGIRGAGKTTVAAGLAASAVYLEDPAAAGYVADKAGAAWESDPEPVLIDEWQLVPSVWNAVRRDVDQRRTPGRFILTGSARSSLSLDLHAGAGRILPVRMYPLTLSEGNRKAPLASLRKLAEHGVEAVGGLRSPFSPERQKELVFRSGLPGYLGMDLAAEQEALRTYLDLAASSDLASIDPAPRNATKLRDYLRAYGAVAGTCADHRTIFGAAGLTKPTADVYHDLLTRLGLIADLPGWAGSRLRRLTKAPKRHLIVPAFAAADHYENPGRDDCRFASRFGELFENAVLSQLRAVTEAEGLGWRFSHLRTAGGELEADIMVDLPEGGVLAVEVKASENVDISDAAHLLKLRDKLGEEFRAGLIVHPGVVSYRLDDRIGVAPLGILV